MDWTNNGSRPPQPAQSGNANGPSKKRKKNPFSGIKLASVALLFSATALVIAVVYFVAVGKTGGGESKYIDSTKLQAVFLNGGQVYFGKIENLNSKSIRMGNIYYLRVNQTVQPNQTNNQQASANDISLVKLGCELHGPKDEMLINRDQVIFWENLKDDGQVAKAVADYVKANPNGQQCATNQSTNTNSTTNSTDKQ